MTSSSKVREALWLSYLRYKLVPSQFPREIFHDRVLMNSEKEFLEALRLKWKSNCFTSVYTVEQRDNRIVDTIFLESDHSALSAANEEHAKMDAFLKNEGIHVRTIFSGRRSYHYYIDFPPVKLMNPSEAIRNFTRKFPIKINIDHSIWGNLSALARIPGTIHESTGMFCVPVNSTPSPEVCVSLEGVEIPEIIPNYGVADSLLGIKSKPRKILPKIIGQATKEIGSIPPCIISLMKFLTNTGSLGHTERLHLGTYLIRTVGMKEAFEFFKTNAGDFKSHYSEYQLKWLGEHDWHCYNCERAKEIGICPMEIDSKCSFYPSINMSF